MAYKKTGVNTKFVVGWKGGPGRPKLPEDIREFRKAVGSNFAGILCELMTVNQGKLHQIHCSPDASVTELICARFLQQAIKEGDVQRMTLLLDRFVGVLPKTVELQESQSKETREVSEKDREKLLSLMLQLRDQPDDEPCKLIQNLPRQS